MQVNYPNILKSLIMLSIGTIISYPFAVPEEYEFDVKPPKIPLIQSESNPEIESSFSKQVPKDSKISFPPYSYLEKISSKKEGINIRDEYSKESKKTNPSIPFLRTDTQDSRIPVKSDSLTMISEGAISKASCDSSILPPIELSNVRDIPDTLELSESYNIKREFPKDSLRALGPPRSLRTIH